MRVLRAWLIRLAGTLRPSSRERELDEELESHLAMHVDDCVRRGMSPEEARREARLRLGGLAQTQESMRERSRLPALASLLADLRFAMRLLRRYPGFSAVAILTLALGIGANVSIFNLVDAVLWRPLPYPHPAELVLAGEGEASALGANTSYATWVDWRARSRSFQELALLRQWQPTLSGGSGAQADAALVAGGRVSANFFRMLQAAPALGRDFEPADDAPAASRVVILGHDLWRRRFAADPAIVGRPITLGGASFTVVGVLGADFEPTVSEAVLGARAELWAPLGYASDAPWACRTCRNVNAVGRLRPGTSREGAAAELAAITSALWKEHPQDYPDARIAVIPLADQLVGSARPVLLVLLGAVGFVWLIACANLTLLLLARATHREHEVAVRMALGAGRARLLRQLLCESCVLALLGAAAGLLPAWLLPRALAVFGPRILPRLADVHIGRDGLLFAFGLALATGVLTGLAPALRLTASDLPRALHDGARTATSSAGRRLRGLMVIAEVALCLTLLVGAGLMVRSLQRLLDVPPGFEPDRVLTMQVSLAGPRYDSDGAILRYHEEVLARLRALPGVEAAALTSQVPLGGNYDGSGLHPEGRLAANPENDPSAQRYSITPDYLHVMGIPLLRGRGLAASDVQGGPPVILINEAAAHIWQGEDPIGRRVKLGGMDGPWWTVVGVVGDVHHSKLDEPSPPQFYVPHGVRHWQWGADTQMIVTLRTAGPPLELAAAAARTVRSVDPAQAVSAVAALGDLVTATVAGRRLSLAMLAAFAALALLLSAIGIHGVTSYAVARRTRELGIRLALGARPAQLLAAILRDGMVQATAGIALGLAASFLLTRILHRLLYGISPTDPATFIAVALLLAAVALAACYIPARRVLRVQPTEALRTE